MATVVLGGGIIGTSIAYYLTDPTSSNKDQSIHIVESSARPFASASGYAAGFLAKDWFSPPVAPLGALSFQLHEQVAKDNDGEKRWGYMKSSALSLDIHDGNGNRAGARGDDWLRDGTSRAEVAAGAEDVGESLQDAPTWLTKQKHGIVQTISNGDDCAQVDPLPLCNFLLETCLQRGVQLHRPAEPVSVVTDPSDGHIVGLKIKSRDSGAETTIPCANVVLAAGSWTPRVFQTLFPQSSIQVPVSPLAGYSLVFRSPRYAETVEQGTYSGRSHAVFTTHPRSCGFSPEAFSRYGSEIYIAGLNSTTIPLPETAEGTAALMDPKKVMALKDVTVRLMGLPRDGAAAASDELQNIDDLEVIREALCFRPVTETGKPIVARLDNQTLGPGVSTGPGGVGRERGGVFVASGHGPWGISLSLGTGKVVAEMVEDVQPSVDVSRLYI